MSGDIARSYFRGSLIAAIVAFAFLSLLAIDTAYFPIDLQVTLALQSLKYPILAALMSAISWLGFSPQSFIITGIIIGLLYGFGLHWEGVMAAFAAVFVAGYEYPGKNCRLTARARTPI